MNLFLFPLRTAHPKAPTACTDKSEKIAPWLVLRKR